MLYLLSLVLPPLAVLLSGKPFQAVLNVFLTLAFWVPGVIHALFVAHNHYADRRMERLIRATRQQPLGESEVPAPVHQGRPKLWCPSCDKHVRAQFVEHEDGTRGAACPWCGTRELEPKRAG